MLMTSLVSLAPAVSDLNASSQLLHFPVCPEDRRSVSIDCFHSVLDGCRSRKPWSPEELFQTFTKEKYHGLFLAAEAAGKLLLLSGQGNHQGANAGTVGHSRCWEISESQKSVGSAHSILDLFYPCCKTECFYLKCGPGAEFCRHCCDLELSL